MRILIFGGNGMLGHKLVQRLSGRFEVWCTLRTEFADVDRFGIFDQDRTLCSVDVTSTADVRRAIESARPDVVVNAAGIIKQVPEASDVQKMFAINAVFPQHLAALGAQYGFRLITISTDCVFAGDRGMYTEADLSDARDLYGISKFLGEAREGNCLTLRTSIIGRELGTRHSIVEWFLANRGGRVKGFTRAIYTGFPTVVFAEIIGDVIEKNSDLRGLYHVSSEPISKFELLTLINRHFDAGITIDPDETYAIDRSLDSTLFRRAVGFAPAPWDEMIGLMAADPTPYDNWSAVNAVA